MQENIPPNEYYEYFAPDFSLHIPSDKTLENCNRRDTLERVSTTHPSLYLLGTGHVSLFRACGQTYSCDARCEYRDTNTTCVNVDVL